MTSEHASVFEEAATYQGLRPGMKLLRQEGIPFTLYDSGGNTMSIYVRYTPDFRGPALMIDRNEAADYDSPDGWDVLLDPGDVNREREDVATGLTGAQLVALIRERIPAVLLERVWEARRRQEEARMSALVSQGLEPMRARLEQEDSDREARGEEIPWGIGDNDPHMIILWIHLAHDALLGITRTEIAEVDNSSPDGWWVCHYRNHDAYMLGEATNLDYNASGDRVVALIDAHLYPERIRAQITVPERGNTTQAGGISEWQDSALYGLITTRDVPPWFRSIDLSQYSSDQVNDLILLACTYPWA
ncbi:hypothetical protein [Nonomuraea sp. SYSU D8015]|uniref:hypothetical protein n=1 Tax=Nonomuraea sp. SYSU D8015 TaxID=2593644 RepID=UPI0016605BD7|nr:hypothetical protein [Nonomuraea sp. SYSU D8015]